MASYTAKELIRIFDYSPKTSLIDTSIFVWLKPVGKRDRTRLWKINTLAPEWMKDQIKKALKNTTTYIEEAGVHVCDDCGSFAKDPEQIEHAPTCTPGESEKWAKFYEENPE